MAAASKACLAVNLMKIDPRRNYYHRMADAGSFLSAGYNQQVLRDLCGRIQQLNVSWICDVGSGSGSNLPLLHAALPSSGLVVFDLNLNALKNGKRACPSSSPVLCDAAAMPLRDGQMDLVLCMEVLEHVEDVGIVVSEIARVLRQGGHAIVSSPNYLNPMGVRKWLKDRQHGGGYWDPWGGHAGFERFMTPHLVGKAFRSLFDVLSVRGAGFLMAWIPLGYKRLGRANDKHPLLGLGRLPLFRDIALNRFLLLRKK